MTARSLALEKRPTPRWLLRGFGVLAILGCGGCSSEPVGPANFLVIVAEDTGLQIGPYGEQRIKTPSLDRLAAQGSRFETVWVTQSSCSSSRSSLFTGTYPHINGQMGVTGAGYSVAPEFGESILTRVLQQAGYRVGLLGKIHLAPKEITPADTKTKLDRSIESITDAVSRFFNQEDSRPFFLMVSLMDAHAQDGKFPLHVGGHPRQKIADDSTMMLDFLGVDHPEARQRVRGYLHAVARVDESVGAILEILPETQRDNTIIMFLSDHGPSFERGKASSYEAGLRIPWIVAGPGIPADQRVDRLTSTIDFYATILDLAGIPVASTPVNGQSLRGALQGTEHDPPQYLYAEFTSHAAPNRWPTRAIRDENYKLILNLATGRRQPQRIDHDRSADRALNSPTTPDSIKQAFLTYLNPPRVELYDLRADPWEFENIAGRAETAKIQNRLLKALEAWRMETADPTLNEVPKPRKTKSRKSRKAAAARIRPTPAPAAAPPTTP